MLDINYIRNNTDEVLSRLSYRMSQSNLIKILLIADARLREAKTTLQTNQSRRNDISKEIGILKREEKAGSATPATHDAINSLASESNLLADGMKSLEATVATEEHTVQHCLMNLPNLPMRGVPLGKSEEHNIEIRKGGAYKPDFDFEPKDHAVLGNALNGMDFEAAGRMSGSRFAFLTGKVARLERALGQYMLNYHVDRGYIETSPPLLVRADAMRGTGQLPKFEEDLFKTTDDRYLIPTAEVPLTNSVAGLMIPEGVLPIRLAALTPCFRAEAGSAGRDTHGLIRQHQFYKVELVKITGALDNEQAEEELEAMVRQVEELMTSLGLHYRVMLLCAGDMGFSAAKTFDIEVWLPGQNAYREISSISYFGDFQARRMNSRSKQGDDKPKFLHTFNGSGVAVGRALVAVMENHQNADGSITIPPVLRQYMNGETVIPNS
jgi:seryl-tRNA synthetase